MGKWLRRHTQGLCIGLAAMLTIGCARDSGTPAGSDSGVSAPVPEDLPGVEMPSEEEALDLARRIEASMAERDDSLLRESVDWDLLFHRTMDGINVSEETRNAIRVGFMRATGSALDGLIGPVQQGATYHLLRARQGDSEMRVIFRLLMPDGNVNYHDLLMVRDSSGSVRVGDIRVALSAEDISAGIHRFYVGRFGQQDESLHVKHIDDIQAMTAGIKSGRPQDVLEIFQSLPPDLQADKTALLIRYRAAAETGDRESIEAAVRDFRRHHPNEACLDGMLIAFYEMNGEFSKALECVDRLDKSVGGDPYLDVLRADCLITAERLEEAKQAARAAVEAEPELIDAYWALATVGLRTKDFAEVSRLLNLIEKQFDMVLEDLTEFPDYAEYVESPEYQEWLESHEQQYTSSNQTYAPIDGDTTP